MVSKPKTYAPTDAEGFAVGVPLAQMLFYLDIETESHEFAN